MQILETELAWMAGFLDGEGSIMLGKTSKTQKPGFYFWRRITISNTRYDILEIFKSRFGGSIRKCTKTKLNVNSKNMFFWCVASKEGEVFLKSIYPYIKLKKIQADLYLEFSKMIPTHGGGPGYGLTDENIKDRLDFVNRMKALNKRGLDVA